MYIWSDICYSQYIDFFINKLTRSFNGHVIFLSDWILKKKRQFKNINRYILILSLEIHQTSVKLSPRLDGFQT